MILLFKEFSGKMLYVHKYSHSILDSATEVSFWY